MQCLQLKDLALHWELGNQCVLTLGLQRLWLDILSWLDYIGQFPVVIAAVVDARVLYVAIEGHLRVLTHVRGCLGAAHVRLIETTAVSRDQDRYIPHWCLVRCLGDMLLDLGSRGIKLRQILLQSWLHNQRRHTIPRISE